MEEIRTPETSVYNKSSQRHIPEDCSLHSYRRENLKSYARICFFEIPDYQPAYCPSVRTVTNSYTLSATDIYIPMALATTHVQVVFLNCCLGRVRGKVGGQWLKLPLQSYIYLQILPNSSINHIIRLYVVYTSIGSESLRIK
jgi:hypothetical protein